MAWAVELSRDAEKELGRLPRDVQKRIERAIDEMESDPFRSNVKALKGPEWKGRYRKKDRDSGTVSLGFCPHFPRKTLLTHKTFYSLERTVLTETPIELCGMPNF